MSEKRENKISTVGLREKKKKKSKAKTIIIIVVICLLAAALIAGGLFVLKPKVSSPGVSIETGEPGQSFGNGRVGWSYDSDGDWFYGSDTNRILRFHPGTPDDKEELYQPDDEYTSVLRVSTEGDWIFFQEEADYCRIKKDGSEKAVLEQNVRFAVIGDGKIFYNKYEEWKNIPDIFVMDLDGSNKKTMLKGNYELWGIDRDWVYYVSYDFAPSEDPYQWKNLYRMKSDGTKQEEIIAFTDKEVLINCVANGNQVFYAVKDGKSIYLKEKKINEGEITLATLSTNEDEWIPWVPINKEGDWVYYGNEERVYKIKTTGGKEELVYQFADTDEIVVFVNMIFVYKGELILSSDFLDLIYITKDGKAIEF